MNKIFFLINKIFNIWIGVILAVIITFSPLVVYCCYPKIFILFFFYLTGSISFFIINKWPTDKKIEIIIKGEKNKRYKLKRSKFKK